MGSTTAKLVRIHRTDVPGRQDRAEYLIGHAVGGRDVEIAVLVPIAAGDPAPSCPPGVLDWAAGLAATVADQGGMEFRIRYDGITPIFGSAKAAPTGSMRRRLGIQLKHDAEADALAEAGPAEEG